MPEATRPSAPMTQIPVTKLRFKLGRVANKMPPSRTSDAATMNPTAPALLSIANMTREKEKMTTPRPTVARTGYSSGLRMRLRTWSLYAASPEARSLQA